MDWEADWTIKEMDTLEPKFYMLWDWWNLPIPSLFLSYCHLLKYQSLSHKLLKVLTPADGLFSLLPLSIPYPDKSANTQSYGTSTPVTSTSVHTCDIVLIWKALEWISVTSYPSGSFSSLFMAYWLSHLIMITSLLPFDFFLPCPRFYFFSCQAALLVQFLKFSK